MLTPPRWSDFPRYPVIAGTLMLAAGTTIAGWAGTDLSALYATADIRRGEWWRLWTSVLPHVGIFHLLFNLYWLWVFGSVIEEKFGHLKTAALLLLFAGGSSALEFAFLDGGVGLSGVGYGFFGLLWMLSRYDRDLQDAIDPRTVQIFLFWFVLCIVTTVTNIMPVANLAHAGGLILGVLIGIAMSRPDWRWLAALGTAAFLVLTLAAATIARPRINMSGGGGLAEGIWGYRALVAHHDAEAVRWFKDAVLYKPNTPAYWFNLGIAEQRVGNAQAAVAAYQRAYKLSPGDSRYQEAVGASH